MLHGEGGGEWSVRKQYGIEEKVNRLASEKITCAVVAESWLLIYGVIAPSINFKAN